METTLLLDGRLTRLLKTGLILFVVAGILSCNYSPNLLAERLKRQLKEKRYEQIYDESSDFMQRNIAKSEFIARSKEIVAELEEYDPELNWSESFIIGDSSGIDGKRYFVRKELGQGSNRVIVLMNWLTNENGKPEFSNMILVLSDQTGRYSLP